MKARAYGVLALVGIGTAWLIRRQRVAARRLKDPTSIVADPEGAERYLNFPAT